jgi:hypothetical protein
MGAILAPTVGVVYAARERLAENEGFPQGPLSQFLRHAHVHREADDLSTSKILDARKIEPSFVGILSPMSRITFLED